MTILGKRVLIWVSFAVLGLVLFGSLASSASASNVPNGLKTIKWAHPQGWAMWAADVHFVGDKPTGRMQFKNRLHR